MSQKEQKRGVNIAYVRVSTAGQNEARQVDALKVHGIDKWFIDAASGKSIEREQLKALLEYVREGDTVYIHDLSRLGRSTSDLLAVTAELERKGVNLLSNKEKIDTGSATGKLIFTMIAAIAEFERDALRERQAEGILAAKRQGKYKGRKRILPPENWEAVLRQYQTRAITASQAMKLAGLKRNTFYRLVREQNEPQNTLNKKD